ncbi:MAG: sulfotransferase [Verrucomicrobiae bacterium]|nr:sulfotransferase [Verrucomicrobiae bacterium]
MSLNKNPIFVIGVFRSGTSLLCSILNQNPAIALMYECDVWNFPRPLLNARFKRNWAERIEFYNRALSRHRLITQDDARGLEKIRTPLDLYQAFGEKKGAAVSGEKSPFYCDRIEQLHAQYRGAFFIFVWRDPVEIYRSVLKAGQTSRFFGKPGMLSRMIYLQEQAIRQATQVEKSGARIHRVEYAGLVDQTEKVCRAACSFLGVPYAPGMLQLNKADLSAIYQAPHHAYLRRGIIERQQYTEKLVPPAVEKKLQRYRHRWELQQARWLQSPRRPDQALPGPVELHYHAALGRALSVYDSLVRAGFEFLPLPWLRVYRLLKSWVVNPPSGAVDENTSLLKDLQRHWFTILVASALLGVISFIHYHANPHLLFMLFYAIPCILLALVVNVRWASLFVLVSSFISPMIQYEGDSDYQSAWIFAWNFFSRFILLEMLVLIIGRIRLDFAKDGDQAG